MQSTRAGPKASFVPKGLACLQAQSEGEAAGQPWEAGVENNLGSVAQTKFCWLSTWSSGLKASFKFVDAAVSA